MSTGYLTSSSLISTIKRIGMIPTSQSTFTNDDFLAMANEEIKMGILPSTMVFHEEYYVRDSDEITLVANQDRYPIPYRAVGGKFREIFYKDTNGNLRSMSRISPDERPYYQMSNFHNKFVYFFIEGNDIVLVPQVQDNPVGSLIFSYYMRPNDLVDENRVANIISISVGASTTTFTVNAIPSNLTSFVQDGVTLTGFSTTSKLDILQRKPGHKTIAFDLYPASIDSNNNTITFNTVDLSSEASANSIVVGDYVSFACECIIPQIPSDLHDVLAHRVMMRCLQALGDAQGYQIAAARLAEMEKYMGHLIDNRAEGTPAKIANNGSLLKASKLRKRLW